MLPLSDELSIFSSYNNFTQYLDTANYWAVIFLASSEWFHLTRNINVLPVNELFSTGSSYFFNFSTHSFGILISIFVLPLFSLSLILKAPCLCVSFNWLNLLRTYHATHFNLKVARDFVILLFC